MERMKKSEPNWLKQLDFLIQLKCEKREREHFST